MTDELMTVPRKRLEDLEAEVVRLAKAVEDLHARVFGDAYVAGPDALIEDAEEDPAAAGFARARAGFRARERQRESS